MKRMRRDAGFSMAALVFFLTASSIMLTIAVPNYVMQKQREREKELIFRGEEYARAIQKYQKTLNLLPGGLDELLQSNGTRFLRQAYTDPVSGEPWRPIFLNQDGTLTGSNVYQSMGQVPTTTSVRNTTAQTTPQTTGTTNNNSTRTTNSLGSASGATGLGGVGGGGTTGTGTTGIGGGTGTGLGAGGTGLTNNTGTNGNRANTTGTVSPTNQQAQPQQAAQALTGLVGVGSGSKGTAVMVYNKQDQYSNWEFIAQLQQQGGNSTSGGTTTGGGGTKTGGGGNATGGGGNSTGGGTSGTQTKGR